MSEVYQQPSLFEQSKVCKRCGEAKSLPEFAWCKRDGYRGICLACQRAANHAHYWKNPEKARENARRYQKENMPKVRERNRRYRAANPNKVREMGRRGCRKWAKTHREYNAARYAIYRQEKPEINRLQQHRRRARVRLVGSDFTRTQWIESLTYFGGHCAYCGQPCERLEIEHMTPISRGGADTAANIVPSCKSCNTRKHDKTLIEWLAYDQ